MRQKVIFQDLGLTDYFDTWQYQTEIHQKLKEEKKIINNPNPSHTLIFCEHHAVFTLGRSGSQENLIVSPEYLAENNIQFYKINRGGDILLFKRWNITILQATENQGTLVFGSIEETKNEKYALLVFI
jgi:lipoate-protein ligase B